MNQRKQIKEDRARASELKMSHRTELIEEVEMSQTVSSDPDQAEPIQKRIELS
jgi:hypothetical protein